MCCSSAASPNAADLQAGYEAGDLNAQLDDNFDERQRDVYAAEVDLYSAACAWNRGMRE
jgi:hypothetical protein